MRHQSSLMRRVHHVSRVAPFDLVNVADVGDVPVNPINLQGRCCTTPAGAEFPLTPPVQATRTISAVPKAEKRFWSSPGLVDTFLL